MIFHFMAATLFFALSGEINMPIGYLILLAVLAFFEPASVSSIMRGD